MKFPLVLLVGVSLLAASVPAYAQSDDAKQAVIMADRAREAALDKGDGEAWAKYIADECRWIELSTGEILQNKTQQAADITKSGPREPDKLSNEKFLIEETLVTQTGVYTTTSGETMHFARIWQRQDGQWLMVALYVDSWPE